MKREIICTLGPSSMKEGVIERLDQLGVSLFRINLSHTKLKDAAGVIRLVQGRTSVPLCLDTEGAQVRTGDLQNGNVFLSENSTVRIPSRAVIGDAHRFNLYPVDIAEKLEIGDLISIDFNSILAQVIGKESDSTVVRMLSGGLMGQNRAVSVERDILMPALTKKDRQALAMGLKMGIRYVALSFANQASDVDEIRSLLSKDVFVISKIESTKGVMNLEEIAAKSDALLLDRGDLSRQVPIEQIPQVQKDVINRANKSGVKIYVATNLLESMVTSPFPTRAEVNDIFNTLNDGASGLVLAAETAIGSYPVDCAIMVSKIIKQFTDSFDGNALVKDYSRLMDKLLNLPSCALITTGRTGADFLQSLLDSHPQVLTFNGFLFYHTFWNNSISVAAGKFDLSDFVDEFIGKHIERLKSRYDIFEGKDQLGEHNSQSIDINLSQFKSEIMKLLSGREVNSKNSMIAIYAAYAICLGQDIEKKTILFHHIHHFEKLENYLKDFPDSKIICMTRDPRANFVSGIEHWKKYDASKDQGAHLYYYINRILADAAVLEKLNNEYVVIRIEDLGKECILRELSKWLNISFHECLRKSTWAGLSWHGDRLSDKTNKQAGFSEEMLQNKWEKSLSFIDKYRLNYIMFYRLRHYGYSYKKIGLLAAALVPFLILLPLSYESRFFSFSYIGSCLRNRQYLKMVRNVVFFLRRVRLFLSYYVKVTGGEEFRQPFLFCK